MPPKIWIIEDEARQSELLTRVLQQAFQGCDVRTFGTAEEALSALASPQGVGLNLAIVDVLIPAGAYTPLNETLPGLDVVEAVRNRLGDHVPVLVRTGVAKEALAGHESGRTVIFNKGRSPAELVELAASMLAVQGFRGHTPLEFLSTGAAIPSGPSWMSPILLVGASSIGASVWTATMLQVTSAGSTRFNSLMVSASLIGGAIAGVSRMARGWRRVALGAAGLMGVFVTGVLLPATATTGGFDMRYRPASGATTTTVLVRGELPRVPSTQIPKQ